MLFGTFWKQNNPFRGKRNHWIYLKYLQLLRFASYSELVQQSISSESGPMFSRRNIADERMKNNVSAKSREKGSRDGIRYIWRVLVNYSGNKSNREGSSARVPCFVTYEFRVIRWANSGSSCARGFLPARETGKARRKRSLARKKWI